MPRQPESGKRVTIHFDDEQWALIEQVKMGSYAGRTLPFSTWCKYRVMRAVREELNYDD